MDSVPAYTIIVHPTGMLHAGEQGYWTEVVELPACTAEGRTIDEAVANTRRGMARWLARVVAPGAQVGLEVKFTVKLAM